LKHILNFTSIESVRVIGAALVFVVGVTLVAEVSAKPTLYLIGDSTVKNGRGDGGGGLWGWGQVFDNHFDLDEINVENHALGGRSSRTFLTEGRWQRVLDQLEPGDFVLIQFGHNDGGQLFEGNRPRASLKGNGDETRDGVVEMTGDAETVHSYGWYLRRYIADAQAKGATPIVLSLVPRNRWHDDHVIRSADDYGRWASEAARDGKAPFIDLNELVSLRYEAIGEETVRRDLFTQADHTHTTKAGAIVNAQCVADGIRQLEDCPLNDFLKPVGDEATEAATIRLDFGSGAVADGYKQVLADMVYSTERGYGFEPGATITAEGTGSDDPLTDDACASDASFYFSIAVPEGNYNVTLTLAPTERAAPTTVKAELRRLMIERAEVNSSHRFTVNVRTPALPDGRSVRLKGREETSEAWAWDDKLTLELNGPHPALAALVVEPADDAVTVYLAGDSTVTDQPFEPWNSWGQMLPRFFQPGVAVANHSQSGESIRSALGERRFDKIFSQIRPGDYLLVQFGHNDMKIRAADALETYRENLSRIVTRTREHGAHPVLVTSMERKSGIESDTLGDYPQTVRDVATEMDVPLIDLHATSKTLYRALGDNLGLAFQDGTHHTSYGSYLFAKCVVQGIRDNGLELAEKIVPDFTELDPARPVSPDSFTVPPSPKRDPSLGPEGS
jgi:lysophospholipase L1-like esterase